MPPLTRYETRGSIFSWWSDSNPPFATINLHAAAKPLLRLQYHFAARNFIEANRGASLSPHALETFSSYLSYRYVGKSTKALVAHELVTRAANEEEARVLLTRTLEQLIQSTNHEERQWACAILEDLVLLPSFSSASRAWILGWWLGNASLFVITELHPSVELLMGRLCHSASSDFIEASRDALLSPDAVETLSSYLSYKYAGEAAKNLVALELATRARNEDEARKVLFRALEQLLQSSDREKKQWACEMLKDLTRTQSLTEFLTPDEFVRLADLSSDIDAGHETASDSMMRALFSTKNRIGQELGKSSFEYLVACIYSANFKVRRRACWYLKDLLAPGSMEFSRALALCAHLVSLFSDEDPEVKKAALLATTEISTVFDGAQAVVDAQALKHVAVMLHSSDGHVRSWTCKMLGRLVSHTSTFSAVLAVDPCSQLVPLLGDSDVFVRSEAILALTNISQRINGARAVLDAKILDQVPKLLQSNFIDARNTCHLLATLANHEATLASLLSLDFYSMVILLLKDPWTRHEALLALASISFWHDGAQAVMKEQPVKCLSKAIPGGFQTIAESSPEGTSKLLQNLARHGLLRRHTDVEASEMICERFFARRKFHELCGIARWLDGAETIVQAGLLAGLPEKLVSASPKGACDLLAQLLKHPSTAIAIFEADYDHLGQLVLLLGHVNHWDTHYELEVRVSAAAALIAACPHFQSLTGITAFKSMAFLRRLLKFVVSTLPEVRRCACVVLASIARYHRRFEGAVELVNK